MNTKPCAQSADQTAVQTAGNPSGTNSLIGSNSPISEANTADSGPVLTESGPVLANVRMAFLGRLAGMSYREASTLARKHGATVSKIIDQRLNLIVLGEDPTVVLESEAWLSQPIAQAIDNRTLEIITETVLWQRLGIEQASADTFSDEQIVIDLPAEANSSPSSEGTKNCSPAEYDLSKLFTTSMIASVLDVPVAAIRLWQKKHLIHPVRQVGRLSYFELQEVAGAKSLAHLVNSGLSPSVIQKKIQQLSKNMPELNRSLDQLSILVSGNEILFRQDDQLLDANGQTYFDFGDEDVPAETDNSVVDMETAGSNEEFIPEQEADYFDELVNRISWDSSLDQQQSWTSDRFREEITWLMEARQLTNALSLARIMAMQYGLSVDDSILMGEILYRLGEKQAARERFFAAVEMDENHLEAKMQLGCVLVEQQDFLLAEALFDGCLKIQPDFPDAHFHLAALLDQINRPDEAVEHWMRFRDLVPDSPWREAASIRLGLK